MGRRGKKPIKFSPPAAPETAPAPASSIPVPEGCELVLFNEIERAFVERTFAEAHRRADVESFNRVMQVTAAQRAAVDERFVRERIWGLTSDPVTRKYVGFAIKKAAPPKDETETGETKESVTP